LALVVPVKVAGRFFALPVESVRRLLCSVEIVELPKPAVPGVLGIIDLEGEVVPVVSVRHLLNLPDQEIDVAEQILIVAENGRSVAFIVDQAESVVAIDENQYALENAEPSDYSISVFRDQNAELVVVLNPSALLALTTLVPAERLLNLQMETL
jgi:purine-binding chemotaxis protein CheW